MLFFCCLNLRKIIFLIIFFKVVVSVRIENMQTYRYTIVSHIHIFFVCVSIAAPCVVFFFILRYYCLTSTSLKYMYEHIYFLLKYWYFFLFFSSMFSLSLTLVNILSFLFCVQRLNSIHCKFVLRKYFFRLYSS